MNIPLLDLFKKKAFRAKAPVAPAAPQPHIEKPTSERLSKTVMPNATRAPGGQDPFHIGANSASGAQGSPGARPTISFAASAPAGRSMDLPPAVAFALEPRVERAISLELGDVVGQLPPGMVRELSETDASRRVLLKASELERGMASGKPSVSVNTIYQQVPEIFLRKVTESDATQVLLPFEKVMEQFVKLQVRVDQNREQSVPQVETPFLKVTLEDDERFGTKTELFQTGDLPPVRVEMATAETIAAAEPEANEKFIRVPTVPMQFPGSTDSNGNGHGKSNGDGLSPTSPIIPSRIPFKISPKGTDAPAHERVPASSGPSVPTSSPTRIPFKLVPTDEAASEAPSAPAEPWLTKENFVDPDAPVAEAAPVSEFSLKGKKEVQIVLPLKPILQSLPPFQLSGDISVVPDDARVEFPYSIVEPQLASGRVLLKPEEFARSLPEEYRTLFNSKDKAATILLSLQDVLKNLPTTSLQMRDDQVEQDKGADFQTPFSEKAAEDAKRLKIAAAPIPKAVITPASAPADAAPAPVAVKPKAAASSASAVAVPGERSALQTLFDTDDDLDAKAVVARVEKMPGIKGCAIMFGDGLSLAGSLPPKYEAGGLCAMAPSLLERIENHMSQTKLGALSAMTLSCAEAAVTFFMQGNLCLAALHDSKEPLVGDIRERLAKAVHELSRKYSNPF